MPPLSTTSRVRLLERRRRSTRSPGRNVGVARLDDVHLAEHLARDQLDVLVVHRDALRCGRPAGPRRPGACCRASTPSTRRHVVRVDRALGEPLADLDRVARRTRSAAPGTTPGTRPCRPSSSVTRIRRTCFSSSSSIETVAGQLGDLRLALGLARLEQLLTTRGRPCVMSSPGDATGVERPHRELRARLADRLGGDDADRLADVDHAAGSQRPAVARGAHADLGLAA